MIDIGTEVRIKDFGYVGVVVGHHGEYNTVEYLTVRFGDPSKKHVNRFGCLDKELERISGSEVTDGY